MSKKGFIKHMLCEHGFNKMPYLIVDVTGGEDLLQHAARHREGNIMLGGSSTPYHTHPGMNCKPLKDCH